MYQSDFYSFDQWKAYLTDSHTILYMVIEEIVFPTFDTEWTITGYCEMSDFLFWLISLVSSPPTLTTLRFPHSSLINTNLGKPSKRSMPSISKPFSSSSAITTFSEGLSSSMKPWFFVKKWNYKNKTSHYGFCFVFVSSSLWKTL